MVHSNRLSIAVCVIGLFAGHVFSQEAGAQIQGLITDASGAAMPDAAVTVTNLDTGVTRTTKSDSGGRYLVSPLQPGRYTLTAERQGWSKYELTGIELQIGTDLEHPIEMKVSSLQSTITVESQTPAINTTSAEISGVVTEQQITTLPVNSRQYLNLALLEPGTTQDASRTFYNNVQAGGGDYFYANRFMIDGVRNTWAEQGEPRQNFPEGAVQEFKVYVAEFPAEFGLYMGGLVTVATKRGTNKLHGEFFEYWRNEALNRDNRFQQQAEATQHTSNPFNRNQFGGDLGGAIIKDRTHFYLAYERTQTSAAYTLFTSASQYYGNLLGTFRQPGYDQMITARVDHQISNNQTLFIRYGQEWNRLTFQGCGASSQRNCYDGLIPRRSFVVGHTWTPSPTIVNEAHFQYAYASYQLGPPGSVWRDASTLATSPEATSQLQIGYVFPSFSYGYGYQEDGIETRWEGNDVLSVQKAGHTLRFGFDINYVPFIDASASNVSGTYTFGTDQVFNPANPASIAALKNPTLFTATIPPIATSVPTWELGFFAQDEWRVRPGLTLNLGLRYDRELGSFNEGINLNSYSKVIPFMGDPSKRGDGNNFGPRVGITWDPFGKGKDVFRAGYGIYYNNIQTLLNFPENRDLASCSITIKNPVYGNPFNGLSATSFCSTAPPTVTVLAPDYVNPYSQQTIAGYSHQFGDNVAVKVNGVYQHTLRDFRVVDLNYLNANNARPLPQWGQILQHQSTAQAKYKALFVEMDKRLSRRYQATVSYTLASARDNNPQSAITNYADPGLSWGPSNIDRRHSLVAAGSVILPWKITLGAIWTVRSSLPFSAYQSGPNADGTAQFVTGTSRNQGNRNLNVSSVNTYRATLNLAPVTASGINKNLYNSFDIHLSRSFFEKEQRRLEVIGQCFNLFGHENLLASGYITSAAAASFGTITSESNLQQAELAARFVF